MGSFTKNVLITFFVRILMIVLGLGASIIIARILEPKGQGIYSLAILLPSLLVIFTDFGVNFSSIFYIGKKQYSPKEVFGNNIILTLLISTFAILIGLIIIFFFGNELFPGIERRYLILALTMVPFSLFFSFIVHIFLGLQKIKKYNLIQFLQSFFFFVLIGIFLLKLHSGISFAILAQIFSFILAGLVLFFLIKKETGGIIFKFSKQYFKDIFVYGFKNYLGTIFSFLHHRIDIFLINIFINPAAVGFYWIAVKLAETIWHFSQSATTVLFPKVVSEKEQKQLKEFTPLVCRNVLFITLLIAFLLFVFGRQIIILFYSEKFLESVQPFQILLIGAVAMSGLRVLGTDLAGRGKPMLNTYITGFSVVLNIILNILMIPRFGILGAALATAISYSTAFIIMVFVYNKVSGNKLKDLFFFKKSDIGFYRSFLLNIRTSRFTRKP